MQWLWDHEGRRYLDLFAAAATTGLGHCHPKLTEVLRSQTDKLWQTTSWYMNSPNHEYARKLVSTLPGELKVPCFSRLHF